MSSEELLKIDEFLSSVRAEILRARLLFPCPDGLLAALTEEVGEVAKALLDEPSENIYTESVQVAAMAARVAIEGDPTLDALRQSRELS